MTINELKLTVFFLFLRIIIMEPRMRASGEQFSTLLEFMESHGDLSNPRSGLQGRLKSERLWSELVTILNSIGGGVNKSVEKWKKVWADWKSKTKKKALLIRRHASGTGGGPSNRQTLSSFEERVLAIMGNLAVEGLPSVQEQGFAVSVAHRYSFKAQG
ncbi:hypothetical protein PYW08_010556 [Mythimna loreyi]|uniref:Uncharacterized protein n=1 Tax=Mythimna loreyi TaxID=667449 RepID=A0ACC2Q9Y5_9NEOP|nr:hypothetical protein PYW08_010556 [Mythimna loreyi]